MAAAIRIGTSGWSYAWWRGRFYPAGLAKARWFEHYAARFDTVELNSTFYGIAAETTFRTWARLAPPGFVYALKAHQDITHRTGDGAAALELFTARATLLAQHLGTLLYQFPPSLHRDLAGLRNFVASLPRNLRHVVEFRDPSWFDDTIRRLLAAAAVGFCVHDMRSSATPDWVTGPIAYVRLHGPGAAKYTGSYGEDGLRKLAARVRAMARRAEQVFVFFNNTAEADAPRDAMALREMLG